MKKKEFIGIRIDEELKSKLNIEAEKQRRSLSNLIIMILEIYIENKERENAGNP